MHINTCYVYIKNISSVLRKLNPTLLKALIHFFFYSLKIKPLNDHLSANPWRLGDACTIKGSRRCLGERRNLRERGSAVGDADHDCGFSKGLSVAVEAYGARCVWCSNIKLLVFLVIRQ